MKNWLLFLVLIFLVVNIGVIYLNKDSTIENKVIKFVQTVDENKEKADKDIKNKNIKLVVVATIGMSYKSQYTIPSYPYPLYTNKIKWYSLNYTLNIKDSIRREIFYRDYFCFRPELPVYKIDRMVTCISDGSFIVYPYDRSYFNCILDSESANIRIKKLQTMGFKITQVE